MRRVLTDCAMLFLEVFARCSKKPPRSRTISFSRLAGQRPANNGGERLTHRRSLEGAATAGGRQERHQRLPCSQHVPVLRAKIARGAERCTDCVTEVLPSAAGHARRPVTTRRSYRDALRNRAKSDQLDLVDMIVRAP